MEKVLTRTNEVAQVIARQLAIAVGFAALYFGACELTPSKSVLAGFAVWKVANVLKAFVLIFPGASVGIATGQWYYNIATGTARFGAYPVMPFIFTALGLGAYFVSKKWGRSTLKDLTILFFVGVIYGTVVALNLTSLGVIFKGTVFGKLMLGAAQFKIFSHTLIVMLGYGLVRLYEGFSRK